MFLFIYFSFLELPRLITTPTIDEIGSTLRWYEGEIKDGPVDNYRVVLWLFNITQKYAIIGQTTETYFNISHWHPELHPSFAVIAGKRFSTYKVMYGDLSPTVYHAPCK